MSEFIIMIGAVADHHDRRAAEAAGPGIGHGMAPARRDLVAHAGKAELEIEGVRRLDAPALGDFAGQAAGGGDQRVASRPPLRSRRRRPARRSGPARWSAR